MPNVHAYDSISAQAAADPEAHRLFTYSKDLVCAEYTIGEEQTTDLPNRGCLVVWRPIHAPLIRVGPWLHLQLLQQLTTWDRVFRQRDVFLLKAEKDPLHRSPLFLHDVHLAKVSRIQKYSGDEVEVFPVEELLAAFLLSPQPL